MNRFIVIFSIIIIISVSIFFSSIIHYKEYEPYQYMKITSPGGDEQLIRINKLSSDVDIFFPSDSTFTNFNWIILNEEQ